MAGLRPLNSGRLHRLCEDRIDRRGYPVPERVASSPRADRIAAVRLSSDRLDKIGGLEAIGIPPPLNSSQPDIAVTDDAEGTGLVPLESVRLVVEVSDATPNFDVTRKLAPYARFGIPEYWVVDVNARIVPFGDPANAVTIAGVTVQTSTP